ncbi:GT2 family glycosyltransferase [Luteococcus japonicus]|uniref:GT2 family glycosyltransferase n=1 Tax=Luteococcus japonicus TaxID=33984 RepID=A0A3N1ZS58_9ACTN|nr:GT2 family glycosyltransferase [Luteococcus japonicus]
MARLDPRPAIIAVDNGSTDASASLLAKALDEGLVSECRQGRAQDGFGDAVRAVESGLDESVTWLWLLHDDVEPRPDALAELLRQGEGCDIVVPKLLEPRRRNHANRIGELGQTIAGSGARVLDVETGDVDQHQLASGEVLGGSTAGLLVSRDAWRELGGTSPELPLFRDGLDLGWRAHEAGLRVVTCPAAGIHHRWAGRTGQREAALAPRPDRTDRLLGMRTVAAHSQHPTLTSLRLALTAVVFALGHLLGKAPGRSLDELAAAWELLTTRSLTAALHRRVAYTTSRADTTHLRPPRGRMLRLRADQFASWVSDRVLPEREADTSIDELTTDRVDGRRARRSLLVPVAMTLVLLAALVAGRRLFGFGTLTGPALAPAPATLSGALDAWLRTPDGQLANAPWLGLGALGSLVGLGRPGWFVLLAQLLAVPVAMLAGTALWHRLLPPRTTAARLLLSLVWGLSLPLLGVTGSGSPGGALLGVALPLAAAAWLDWVRRDEDDAAVEKLRAPARYALWSTLAAVALPALLLPLWGFALAGAMRRGSLHVPGLAVAVFGPLLALAPWLVGLVRTPSRLLTGPDPLLAARAVHASTPWGNTPWWLFSVGAALLWLAACWALVVDPRTRRLALAGAALTAWVLGLVLPRLALPLHGGTVRADASGWLLLATLVLLALCPAALTPSALNPSALNPGRLLRRATGILLALLAAGQLGWWLGAAGAPVHRTRTELPASVVAVEQSNRATRTLLVDAGSIPARWSLHARDLPRWGSAEGDQVPDPALRQQAQALAAAMASGTAGEDLADGARALGIGHLWLRGGDDGLVSAVSDTPGLGPAEAREGATTWTVTGLVTRTPDREWAGPRRGWPAGLGILALLVLAVLAAPTTAAAEGPRRAAAQPGRRSNR